jgi:hypothetical protein
VAEGKRLTVSLELSHDESYPFRSSLKHIQMLHSKYVQPQVAAVMHAVPLVQGPDANRHMNTVTHGELFSLRIVWSHYVFLNSGDAKNTSNTSAPLHGRTPQLTSLRL